MTQSRSACAAQAVDDGWPVRVSIGRDTIRPKEKKNEAKVNMFHVLVVMNCVWILRHEYGFYQS